MEITSPLSKEDVLKLKVGDIVYVNGEILTARDKAHMRILEYMQKGKDLPIEIDKRIIYHCGPLMKEVNDEWIAVSAGPTTSARMNGPTPKIISKIERIGIIGKGGMDDEVVKALKGKGFYLAYTGGAGALAANAIKKVKGIYWEDLGMAEAIWHLEVKRFGPCIVGIDAHGNSLYSEIMSRVEDNFKKIISKL